MAVCTCLARADDGDTAQSAIFLLKDATQPQRDGRHSRAMRALRQLRDPELHPFFVHLMAGKDNILRIHAFLGAAESDPKKGLDLARLASVKDEQLQAEMLSAALDSELLTLEQARQAVNWPGLDITVRLLVAIQLTHAGEFKDIALLQEAGKSDNLARQALAGLTLVQLGQAQGKTILDRVDASKDLRRDEARELALQTMLRFDFDKAAGWAMKISIEPDVSSRLNLLGLRGALRFGAPGAVDAWRQSYESTNDLAQRTRLAFLALNIAQHLPASFFDPLNASNDASLRQIGRAGAAIAGKQDVAPAVIELIKSGHPVATAWALAFVTKQAAPADARAIELAIIQQYPGPARNQAQRFDDAVTATQLLFEQSPQEAQAMLRPIVAADQPDEMYRQAVLLGLIRSKGQPHLVIQGLLPYTNASTNGLALLLLAKNGQTLTPAQMAELATVVRGGGSIPESLRLQAAWIWLKRNKMTPQALEALTALR